MTLIPVVLTPTGVSLYSLRPLEGLTLIGFAMLPVG